MWRDEFDALGLLDGALADGAQVVVAGGPDYYPGVAHLVAVVLLRASPSLRVAGEGDLLAQLERAAPARWRPRACSSPRSALPRPALPRTIGVVTGEGGKARDDVLAGLRRRGWAGRLVWAFAPVQDRHAAPAITRALQDLAAVEEVDVIVVARGGGSLADLFAFCDETLCRTVALLRVPVIASVGHHTDRTLIDDVAAVSCSTPTHAAETAVPLRLRRGARARCAHRRARLARARAAAPSLERARAPGRSSRARPAEHVARQRRRLHQQLRELRASARAAGWRERRATTRAPRARARAQGHGRRRRRRRARRRDLERLAPALAAHDPERVLERGYALVDDAPATS